MKPPASPPTPAASGRGLEAALATHGRVQVLVTLRERPGEAGAAPTALPVGLAAHFLPPGPGGAPAAVSYFPHLGMCLGSVDRRGLAGLRRAAAVAELHPAPEAGPARCLIAAGAPTLAPAGGTAWGVKAVRAPELWKLGWTGRGVKVAHLDTGVDARHPALRQAVARFVAFDDQGVPVRPARPAFDSNVHGTHTAATIAGRPYRRGGRTYRFGVAPGARLLSAVVVEGGNTVARVLAGMNWALAHRARILSLSVGLRGWWPQFRAVARRLRARGVLCVFAVGNAGIRTSCSPGNYPEVLSVGAVQADGRVAAISSSQSFARRKRPLVPLILGPGESVWSARPGGGELALHGSSMAAPHLAGLAALLLEARPRATVDELEAALLAAAGPVQPAGRAAHGLPDGLRALAALGAPPPRRSRRAGRAPMEAREDA